MYRGKEVTVTAVKLWCDMHKMLHSHYNWKYLFFVPQIRGREVYTPNWGNFSFIYNADFCSLHAMRNTKQKQGCKCRLLPASWGGPFRQRLIIINNNKVTCRLRDTTWLAGKNVCLPASNHKAYTSTPVKCRFNFSIPFLELT